MREIEPTVENVQPGDTVTLERGAPGEPGHASLTYLIASSPDKAVVSHEVTVSRVQNLTESDMGYRITRITRPAPPIPTIVGERFWARYEGADYVEEFIVTRPNEATLLVSLHDGLTWTPEEHGESFTVVPAPEPETVPVPADLIREAGWWRDSLTPSSDVGVGILTRIVWAVRRGVRVTEEGEK